MHEWMVDNDFTPHIVVDAAGDGVRVPPGHVQDGKIVLNVSPSATRALALGNDVVTFEARFNGVAQQLSVPVAAVLGIYARETGQGMLFSDETAAPPTTPAPDGGPPPAPQPPAPRGGDKPRPKLKVIK
jgi:stringent starvation protein B